MSRFSKLEVWDLQSWIHGRRLIRALYLPLLSCDVQLHKLGAYVLTVLGGPKP